MAASAHRKLWQLSAVELAAAYKAGDTTPEAVLDATLGRLEAVNPRVNAVVTLDIAGARMAAGESTRRWRANSPLGPLDGVPVTIKDNILTKDMRSTWGSRLYAGYVPAHDEEPVARLRRGGAVILGKTNVPEFTLHGFTDNALFGPTRNPWNLALTPGGSSGGAVAAVACGVGPLALCTDGGGSIRRPAAHTGLVGLKPSRGMVPRGQGFPAILHDFEVVGPVARNVDDIAAAMDVIASPGWRRPAETPRPLRILHIAAFGEEPVEPVITDAVNEMASLLRESGHHVERAGHFDLAQPIAAVWPAISSAGLAWLLSKHENAETLVGPALLDIARKGATIPAVDYVAALDTIAAVGRGFDDLFSRIDVLLTPATAAMPWPANETHPPAIAGKPVGPRGHAVFTPFANALGLPAISLPCRQRAENMPIGFQLCAAAGRDGQLLTLARDCERRLVTEYLWPLV